MDDLRAAAGSLDASLQPSSNETPALLGALIHYTEHGDAFLAAAEDGPAAVSDFLASDDDTAEPKEADAKSSSPTAAATPPPPPKK
jgi:hypothetical protein